MDRIKQEVGHGSITITNPNQNDSGRYQCFAENRCGTSVSNSVFVRIIELNLVIIEKTISLNATIGAPLTLKCQPSNAWPQSLFHWFKLKKSDENITFLSLNEIKQHPIINSSNDYRLTVDPIGNLHFSNVIKDDEIDHFYACAMSSKLLEIYQVVNRYDLKILNDNETTEYLLTAQYISDENKTVQLGESVEFNCIFGGTPLPDIVWKKGGLVRVSSEF